ncbi:hypothetical protein ACLKA6_010664 [Drosophila palustris]
MDEKTGAIPQAVVQLELELELRFHLELGGSGGHRPVAFIKNVQVVQFDSNLCIVPPAPHNFQLFMHNFCPLGSPYCATGAMNEDEDEDEDEAAGRTMLASAKKLWPTSLSAWHG